MAPRLLSHKLTLNKLSELIVQFDSLQSFIQNNFKFRRRPHDCFFREDVDVGRQGGPGRVSELEPLKKT